MYWYTFIPSKLKYDHLRLFDNQITSKLIKISLFTAYKTLPFKKKQENSLNVNVHAVRPFM